MTQRFPFVALSLNIVEDFISVLPRYAWRLSEDFEGWSEVRLQKHVGYRLQINLHVAVKTEAGD